MLSKLFIPKVLKTNVYQYLIGYQNLIVIDYQDFKDDIIVDKTIKKLILSFHNLYFFNTIFEMEEELELLINNTNDDYIVIIN